MGHRGGGIQLILSVGHLPVDCLRGIVSLKRVIMDRVVTIPSH